MKHSILAIFMLALGAHSALLPSESPCRQLGRTIQAQRADTVAIRRLLGANPTLDPRCRENASTSPFTRLKTTHDRERTRSRVGTHPSDMQSLEEAKRIFEDRIKSLDSRK